MTQSKKKTTKKVKKERWNEFRETTIFRIGLMTGYFISGLFLFLFGIMHKDFLELLVSNFLLVAVLLSFWLINIQYRKYKNDTKQ